MKYRLVIFLFMVIIISCGLLNAFLPSSETVSELENRTLTVFPKLSQESFFSGDFFRGIENYYADHLFQREKFVLVSQKITAFKGIRGKDNVVLLSMGSTDEYVPTDVTITDNASQSQSNGGQNMDEQVGSDISNQNGTNQNNEGQAGSSVGTDGNPSLSSIVKYQEVKKPLTTANDLNQRVRNYAKKELEYFADIEPLPPVLSKVNGEIEQFSFTNDETLEGGRKNGLLIIADTCYEIFGYSEKSCAYYANAINSFKEQLEETDTVYSIVVPSHIEFVQSEKYRSMAMSQADAINYINEQFSDEVRPVNIYSTLAEHSQEYLYFRSDHHWTALGAYYAYSAFATAIGDKPYELDAFEHTVVEGFLGTLYNKSLSKEVKNNPDSVDIYMPFVKNDFTIYTPSGSKLKYDLINMKNAKSSNKYLIFISGDNPLSIIDTELDNGKKIMVFKDSYGNAFIPYLTSHYDEIHIIDPRHYKQGAISYAKENDIHEFLFINSATVISGNTGFAKNIYKVSY